MDADLVLEGGGLEGIELVGAFTALEPAGSMGGWYRSVRDPAHHEFLGTREDAVTNTPSAKLELGKGDPRPYPRFAGEADRVRAVQEQLAPLGFDRGDIDGVYGPDSRTAVEAFEASEPRLASKADGTFGPLTWRPLLETQP